MSVRLESANGELLSRAIVGAQDWTLGGWFYLHALPGAGERAPLLSAYSADFTGLEVGVDESGNVYIWGANGNDFEVGTGAPVSAESWFYLWVVYDHSETEAHAFLGGSETPEVSHPGLSLGNSSPTLNLGSNDNSYRTVEYADASIVGWKAWAGAALAPSLAAAEAASCVMVEETGGYAEWPLSDETDLADQLNDNDLSAVGTLSAGVADPGGYSCGGGGGGGYGSLATANNSMACAA